MLCESAQSSHYTHAQPSFPCSTHSPLKWDHAPLCARVPGVALGDRSEQVVQDAVYWRALSWSLTGEINLFLRACDCAASPFQARLLCAGSAIARSYLNQIGSTSSDSPVLLQSEMKIILEGRASKVSKDRREKESAIERERLGMATMYSVCLILRAMYKYLSLRC